MPSPRVISELRDQIYFVTFTVHNWYYFFDKFQCFDIVEDSFVFCQRNKGLKIYAYVFMPNHLHFIASSDDLGSVICSIKTFLSKEFKRIMLNEYPKMLLSFQDKKEYRFWIKTNCPKLIYSEDFFQQKVDYIHYNPVKKHYVHEPEDWRWSSASKIPSKIMISSLEP